MAKILVVGGAGYVGSATCAWLVDAGHEVWVLDNLSTGHRELVLGKSFSLGHAGDSALVSSLALKEKFDCVMHFAAKSIVGESVKKPTEYFENNVTQTRILLETLLGAGVRNFIFSSTCAIFGDPGDQTIDESLPQKPLNPYGETKLEVERLLQQLAQEKGLRSIALRYFNAAGAEPRLRVGEWHQPETHLIPRVLYAALKGVPIEIYGTDYPTPDGTCIRDYIHVWDLAAAHGKSMERLLTSDHFNGLSNINGLSNDPSSDPSTHGLSKGLFAPELFEAYNLGSEHGFSVREVIQACQEVTGKNLKIIEKPRRPGDAARLVANSNLAKKVLGYQTQRTQLKDILTSAWEWEKEREKKCSHP